MTDLRKAAEAVLEAWGWDWSEPRNEALKERMEALRQALAQPEQRGHCTCGNPEALGIVHFRTRPCIHYTAPPKREWVGLTDAERFKIARDTRPYVADTMRAHEEELKRRNNG